MPDRKPWRNKPEPSLRYWTGKPKRDIKIKTIIVYCVGDVNGKVCGQRNTSG